MVLDKDYDQILQDIVDAPFMMFKPMDVRQLLKLDTKAAYALFSEDDSFPSVMVTGKNYILKDKLIEWVKETYLS